MAAVPRPSVGYLNFLNYDDFDQCTTFCIAKKIDCHTAYEYDRNNASFKIYFFCLNSASRALEFTVRIGLNAAVL